MSSLVRECRRSWICLSDRTVRDIVNDLLI